MKSALLKLCIYYLVTKLLLRSSKKFIHSFKSQGQVSSSQSFIIGGDEFKCITYSESSLKLYYHSIGCAWQHICISEKVIIYPTCTWEVQLQVQVPSSGTKTSSGAVDSSTRSTSCALALHTTYAVSMIPFDTIPSLSPYSQPELDAVLSYGETATTVRPGNGLC